MDAVYVGKATIRATNSRVEGLGVGEAWPDFGPGAVSPDDKVEVSLCAVGEDQA